MPIKNALQIKIRAHIKKVFNEKTLAVEPASETEIVGRKIRAEI
jgi:hypothetical protein